MPKRKYIPQPELKMTDQQLLMQRQIILELINKDRFQFIKTYTNTDEKLFIEIKDILSKASKKDQIFIKNYFILPDELKADYEINKSALTKNPYIYHLMNHDKIKYAINYAKILMSTDGNFYKYLSPDLVEQNKQIALNAVISSPVVFKDLPTKYKISNDFILKAIQSNSLVYCYLSESQKANTDYITSSLKTASFDDINISQIYKAAPNVFQNLNKSDIHKFLKLAPGIYRFFSSKLRSDKTIAAHALEYDYTQIKYVPKKLHFSLEIMDTYFSSKNLKHDILLLVYKFKALTQTNITTSDLIDKIIQISPKDKMKLIAAKFGDADYPLLNTKNIRNLLLKDPKAFSNLRFVHYLLHTNSDVIEQAIKLDYRNIQYIDPHPDFGYGYSEDLVNCIYEDFFKLAIKTYHANGSKGVHPYGYVNKSFKSFSYRQLKKIVTHKINGKVAPDYVNIFKHGSVDIRRIKTVYVHALNHSPKLALYYPVTETSKKNIFEGLNLRAQKALFDPWIKKQGLEDILEIAHLKDEIFNPTTQSVAKVT